MDREPGLSWIARLLSPPQTARIVAAPKLAAMRIALAQILSGTDPAANLQLVREYAAEAAGAGAKLVVFPEATMCRFGVPLGPVAEPVDGPWADGVRRIAADSDIAVIAGMFTPAGDGRVKNTLIAAGPATPNQPNTHYDKIHLYDAFGFTESRTVAAGDEPVVIAVDGVVVPGLAADPHRLQPCDVSAGIGQSGLPIACVHERSVHLFNAAVVVGRQVE